MSGLMGAAPLIAKRTFENPAAALSFDLKTPDNPGIFKPILRIVFDSIAAVKLEYIFSYILGTDINKCGWISFA